MAIYVGDRGTATSPLQPQGVVLVNGERLDARAEFGLIEPGCEVVVVTGDHMGLVVRKLEPGSTPQLPDHGKKLCTSFDERITEESERQEAERQAWLEEHHRTGTILSTAVGTAAAVGAIAVLWGARTEQTDSPWAAALLLVVGGAVVGGAFFRALDEVLGQIDPHFRRVTTASTVLGLLGLAAGAALAIPPLGVPTGLLVGLAAALLFAAVPVVLIILSGGAGAGA
jgi:hypothetical protein